MIKSQSSVLISDKIEKDAGARYEIGQAEHGIFDPGADRRDLVAETYQELLDALNYWRMLRIQIMMQRPSLWENTELLQKWHFLLALILEVNRGLLEFRDFLASLPGNTLRCPHNFFPEFPCLEAKSLQPGQDCGDKKRCQKIWEKAKRIDRANIGG